MPTVGAELKEWRLPSHHLAGYSVPTAVPASVVGAGDTLVSRTDPTLASGSLQAAGEDRLASSSP